MTNQSADSLYKSLKEASDKGERISTLLKTRDLADWLVVSEWRIYDLVRQNLIPHIRMGRSIRFEKGAIKRWLEAGGTGLEEK